MGNIGDPAETEEEEVVRTPRPEEAPQRELPARPDRQPARVPEEVPA